MKKLSFFILIFNFSVLLPSQSSSSSSSSSSSAPESTSSRSSKLSSLVGKGSLTVFSSFSSIAYEKDYAAYQKYLDDFNKKQVAYNLLYESFNGEITPALLTVSFLKPRFRTAPISYEQWLQNGERLVKAAESLDIDTVKDLLDSNEVDVNFILPSKWKSHTALSAVLLRLYDEKMTPEKKKQIEEISLLLIENNADCTIPVEENDETCFIVASECGMQNVVRAMLNAGTYIDQKDGSDRTALMLACMKEGDYEIVKLLLESGAKVNKATINKECQKWDHRKSFVADHHHRSDNHINFCNGTTALILASFYGHTRIVELLLRYGADINAMNSEGHNALSVAQQQEHKEIIEILEAIIKNKRDKRFAYEFCQDEESQFALKYRKI